MLKEATAHLPGIEVDSFSGLLAEYARRREIEVIVKGLRAVSDYEYELQMSQMNRRLAGIETLFVASSPEWSFLSSSIVKEVARFGGSVEGLVPDFVRDRLDEKLGASA